MNFGDVEVDVDVIYDVERVQATSASLTLTHRGCAAQHSGNGCVPFFPPPPPLYWLHPIDTAQCWDLFAAHFLAKFFLQLNSILEKYHQSFPQMMFSKECKCFRIYNYVLYLYFTLKSNLI